jgi:hypothetical protein
MLRLIALLVYLQFIFVSSTHSGMPAGSPGLRAQPAPKADTGGGLDPWGSHLQPQPAPTADSGGGFDPWG